LTRINVVPVETLTTQHLVAAYRENPRILALVEKAIQRGESPTDKRNPKEYTLGTGHCRFFYDKLGFIVKTQKQLVNEMLRRGYKPQHTECLYEQFKDRIDKRWWGSYQPTEEALRINQERIDLRNKEK